MADEPSSGAEESADEWLSDGHSELSSGLSRFLDLDGGLREVRLHVAGHGELVRGLGRVLDVERGLRGILRPGEAGVSVAGGTGRPEAGQLDAAAAVRAVPVGRRLAVRKDAAIHACVVSDLLVRTAELAVDFERDRRRPLAETGRLDIYRERVFDLAADLDRASGLGLPRGLARSLTPALAFDRDLDLALVLARDLELDLDLARDLARDLDLACGLDLDLVRGVAKYLALKAGRLLNLEYTEGIAGAFLDGALDDFTDADLTDVNLADLDLSGIRWSADGTRWPPGTDIEALLSNSQETAPNSGVYVLMPPPGGMSWTSDGVRV
ncbi:hypothetical protein OK074_5448 [Actinobacteria bacterium OK074]|nr:hypothetical protein OK074_5448 [Actinobacteria bacterium OK074]